MLTQEEYDNLKKLDRNLKLAVQGNCYSGMYRSEIELLVDVYNKHYNQNKKYSSCNHCILEMLKKLGKEYITYQQTHNNTKAIKKRTKKDEQKS